MPRITAEEVQTIPYGPLGIIALPGTENSQRRLIPTLLSGEKIKSAITRKTSHSTAIKEQTI